MTNLPRDVRRPSSLGMELANRLKSKVKESRLVKEPIDVEMVPEIAFPSSCNADRLVRKKTSSGRMKNKLFSTGKGKGVC